VPSSSDRLELANLLMRMAVEAERQNPQQSWTAPMFRHYAKLASSSGPTGDDWDLIAQAAFRFGERLVSKVPEQRARPAVVERGPRTPSSA
jgi:hypothetical protein